MYDRYISDIGDWLLGREAVGFVAVDEVDGILLQRIELISNQHCTVAGMDEQNFITAVVRVFLVAELILPLSTIAEIDQFSHDITSSDWIVSNPIQKSNIFIIINNILILLENNWYYTEDNYEWRESHGCERSNDRGFVVYSGW